MGESMKINYQCLPCLINQVVKVSMMIGVKDKEKLYHKVFKYLSDLDFKQTNPEIIGEVFKLIKEQTNNKDPYYDIRKYYNNMFLNQESAFEKSISDSNEEFVTAIKYAVIANIIDFNPIKNKKIENILQHFDELKQQPLTIDHHLELLKDIKESKSLLYIGDNCGEICLDKILIKKIKTINPKLKIYFATREVPIINDSIEEDAYMVGINEYATIINNGDYSLGTILNKTSHKFNQIYEQADIIISKGQANFESLSEENKNIYFLLITKCEVIANYLNTGINKLICMKINSL